MDITTTDAEAAALLLRRGLSDAGIAIGHRHSLALVAQQLGFADWDAATSVLGSEPAGSGPAVPVLRIQEEKMARAFYLDYLGFVTEWEHRFEKGLPVYLRIRRGETVLDLSEHHGDGVPGTVVWVPVRSISDFHGELMGRRHQRQRPGIDQDAPGGPTVEVIDPWGNVLRFCAVSG